jgi:hypothetical protein
MDTTVVDKALLNEAVNKLFGQRLELSSTEGRAIAQAVIRWLSTVAARVRSRGWSSGICGRQSGAGTGFLRLVRFPVPTFIPPNSPSS